MADWTRRYPCVICYGSASPSVNVPHSKGGTGTGCSKATNPTTSPEALARFFKLLEAYLLLGIQDNKVGIQNGSGAAAVNSLEEVIQAGMRFCCEDCSKLMESFCELYHNMISIELQLNRKLMALKEIMSSAQKKPARIRGIQKCLDQLEIGQFTANDVINLKEELVGKCERKLNMSGLQLALSEFGEEKFESVSSSSDKEMAMEETVQSTAPEVVKNWKEAPAPLTSTIPIQYTADDGNNMVVDLQLEQCDPNFGKLTLDFSSIMEGGGLDPVNRDSQLIRRSTNAPFAVLNGKSNKTTKPSKATPAGTRPSTRNIFRKGVRQTFGLPPLRTAPRKPLAKPEWNDRSRKGKGSIKRKCCSCARHFRSFEAYQQHFQLVHSHNIYTCQLCGAGFNMRGNYSRHYLSLHMGMGGIKCGVCSSTFSRRDKLLQHQRTVKCFPFPIVTTAAPAPPSQQQHSNNAECKISDKLGAIMTGTTTSSVAAQEEENQVDCEDSLTTASTSPPTTEAGIIKTDTVTTTSASVPPPLPPKAPAILELLRKYREKKEAI